MKLKNFLHSHLSTTIVLIAAINCLLSIYKSSDYLEKSILDANQMVFEHTLGTEYYQGEKIYIQPSDGLLSKTFISHKDMKSYESYWASKWSSMFSIFLFFFLFIVITRKYRNRLIEMNDSFNKLSRDPLINFVQSAHKMRDEREKNIIDAEAEEIN